MPVIVPLDDHWNHIRRVASATDPSAKKDNHADLLLLGLVEDANNDWLQIWPSFIEVKYRSDGELPADALEQVGNSWKVFCTWLCLRAITVKTNREGYCEFGLAAEPREEMMMRLLDLSSILSLYIPAYMQFNK